MKQINKTLFKKIKTEWLKKEKTLGWQWKDGWGVNIWPDKTFEITYGLNSEDCLAYIGCSQFSRGTKWEDFQLFMEEVEAEMAEIEYTE